MQKAVPQQKECAETASGDVKLLCRLCAETLGGRHVPSITIWDKNLINDDLMNKVNAYLPIQLMFVDETVPLECCAQCFETIMKWHEFINKIMEGEKKWKIFVSTFKHEAKAVPIEGNIVTTGNHSVEVDLRRRRSRKDIQFEYDCDVCHKGFTRRYDVRRHRIQKHPDVPPMNNHKATEDAMLNVDAKINYSSATEMLPTIIRDCKNYGNGSQFETALGCEVLKLHNVVKLQRRRRPSTALQTIFKHECMLCGNKYTRNSDLNRHQTLKHPHIRSLLQERAQRRSKTSQQYKVVDALTKEVRYECPECNKSFKFAYLLGRHRYIHNSTASFCCHICGKQFRVEERLKRHIRLVHVHDRKFKCGECGARFAMKSYLSEHMRTHSDWRSYICEYCGKAFRQSASLRVHRMLHRNDNFNFKCSTCSKQFRRARDLKVHSWIHTGEKPHKCKMCKMSFCLSSDLRRHHMTHTDAEICKCSQCGVTFMQRRYLVRHMKLNHPQQTVT